VLGGWVGWPDNFRHLVGVQHRAIMGEDLFVTSIIHDEFQALIEGSDQGLAFGILNACSEI
jgi:hypothetical protein